MRLLRSELLRARSRRLVPMLVIGGLLGIVIGLGIAAIYSSPPSQATIDRAQAQYQREFDRCMKGRYLGPNEDVPVGYDSLEEFCRDNSGPYIEDPGLQLRDLPQILEAISMFVVLLGAWLGASLGGADWTTSVMTTLLTWEPRRIRVLLVRALVVLGFVFVITLFLQAVFVGLYDLVATTRGMTAFAPPDLWSDVGETALRISVVAVAIGLVAYAVAMIGRSTVASLGALFGYLILFEGVIAGFRPSIQAYLLVRAATVIVGQSPILDYSQTATSYGEGVSQTYAEPVVLLDVPGAWVVAGVYVVGLLVVALFVFRRRDVS